MTAAGNQRVVEEAAANCPVSRALAGVEINIDAEPAGSDPRSSAGEVGVAALDE